MQGNTAKREILISMKADLQLRCPVLGHEKTIRTLGTFQGTSTDFVSGAQDGSVRVWSAKTDGNGFHENFNIRPGENPISAVCILPPTGNHPRGLLAVASDNESVIRVLGFDSQEPLYQLTGHSDTVCALAAGRYGSLLSGSADKTARVWIQQKCILKLEGHTATVSCVAIVPEGGRMLTGSDDKTLKCWKTGKCEQTFNGHTSSVRCIAVLSAQEILSGSDDHSVRLWLIADGSCVRTFAAHTDRVRGIAVLPSNTIGDFVSCGDDRTLRVWQGETLKQTIVLPIQSASTVCILSNGDVAVGASDAAIYVFTSDEQRVATEAELKTFSDSVAKLLSDSNRNTVQAGIESKPSSTVKQTFNGKEYDFVFDVEIYKDKPPLKLPYNLGDNARDAASIFIECHKLDKQHLDMVTKFITDHATPSNLMRPAVAKGAISKKVVNIPSNEFFPETAYITFNQLNTQQIFGKIREFNNQAERRNCHQFTSDDISVLEKVVGNTYKPLTPRLDTLKQMLQWPPALLFPVLDALRLAVRLPVVNEYFCNAVESANTGTGDETPASNNTNGNSSSSTSGIENSVVTSGNTNDGNSAEKPMLVNFACRMLSSRSPPKNQLLMLRVLCNMFEHPTGERWAMNNSDTLLSAALSSLRESAEKPIQVAVSSLLLNLTIGHRCSADLVGIRRCLLAAAELSQEQFDTEALFRLLVAMGTAIVGHDELTALAKTLSLENFVHWCQMEGPDKNRQCAELLGTFLGIASAVGK